MFHYGRDIATMKCDAQRHPVITADGATLGVDHRCEGTGDRELGDNGIGIFADWLGVVGAQPEDGAVIVVVIVIVIVARPEEVVQLSKSRPIMTTRRRRRRRRRRKRKRKRKRTRTRKRKKRRRARLDLNDSFSDDNAVWWRLSIYKYQNKIARRVPLTDCR